MLQRRALPPGGTRVTAETFAAWKSKKKEKKAEAAAAEKKKAAAAAGPAAAAGSAAAAAAAKHLSGRDLFSINPELFVDCEGAANEEDYQQEVCLCFYFIYYY